MRHSGGSNDDSDGPPAPRGILREGNGAWKKGFRERRQRDENADVTSPLTQMPDVPCVAVPRMHVNLYKQLKQCFSYSREAC